MNALQIKEARKRLGLTQAELAKRLGVSLKTISNYESGEVIPITKLELLHSILSNNTLNETTTEYIKTTSLEEKILELEEKIKVREEYVLDLENIHPANSSKIEHQKEIINVLKMRLDLIVNSGTE